MIRYMLASIRNQGSSLTYRIVMDTCCRHKITSSTQRLALHFMFTLNSNDFLRGFLFLK